MKKYYSLLCLGILCQISFAQNTWVQKSDFGGAERMGAVGFAIGTKGYLGTGGNFGPLYYQDFWEYDQPTDVWTQVASLTGGSRYRSIGVATDSFGYVATGYNNGTSYYDLWQYDPTANSWTQKSNMSTARFGAVSFVIGQNIYVGTGGYMNDFWEYNTATDVWTQKANFGSSGRYYAAGFSIADKGYLGTGVDYSQIGIGKNDFYEYDATSNSWTQKANVPGQGRSEAFTFTIGDYGYIGTGTNNWGIGALSDMYRYDPSTDTWATMTSYPGGAIEEGTAFVIGCLAYVGTGFTNDNNYTLQTSLYEYTPEFGCTLPLAAMASSDTLLCEATCIDFFDQSSSNPTSWEWSFPGGNPSTSSLQNPTNICYGTAGTYDVTLIVGNGLGYDTIVMPGLIQVDPAPVANITQSNDTLYSSSGNSYQWFTGGYPIAGATDQFYIPAATGSYSVELTGSNGCTAADTIFFTLGPISNFSAADTTICEKFCMDFNDLSTNYPTAWQWYFEGGSPASSTAANPANICYNTPGIYNVTLITSNVYGSDTLVFTDYITVYATPSPPTITQNGNVLTCSNGSGYHWQLNGVDIPGATGQSYTFTEPGLYTVYVYDENGCASYADIIIEGVNDPAGDMAVDVFPNPSDGKLIIDFAGTHSQTVSLRIVNAIGQQVRRFDSIPSPPGYKIEINLHDAAAGVYVVEITSGDILVRKKVVVGR